MAIFKIGRAWLPRWQKYEYVESQTDESDDEKSLSRAFLPDREHSQAKKPSRELAFYSSIVLNGVLSISMVVLLARAWPQLGMQDRFNNTLIKQTSMSSPILDQIHIPINTVRRNGSLLPNHPASIFREEPSEEVDMAWHRLSNINPIPMSAKYVKDIGYNPEDVARWPEEYGLGDDAYVARLDVFHEIHCLDMIRRAVYFDYYYEKRGWETWHDASGDWKVHISHCFYALLQSLTCSANTDPFIHFWVDVGDEPFPDFSINRQCRDFETVLKWQEENSIPMSQYRDVIRKPAEVTSRIMSLEYKYMVGMIKEDPALVQEALKEADLLADRR